MADRANDKKLWVADVEVYPKAAVIRRPRYVPRLQRSPDESKWSNCAMQTAAGERMRCRNRSCSRTLPARHPAIVCSDACSSELRAFCEATLAVLNEKMDPLDYPTIFRSLKSYIPHAKRSA